MLHPLKPCASVLLATSMVVDAEAAVISFLVLTIVVAPIGVLIEALAMLFVILIEALVAFAIAVSQVA